MKWIANSEEESLDLEKFLLDIKMLQGESE